MRKLRAALPVILLAGVLSSGCSGQAAVPPALITPVTVAEDTVAVARRDVVASKQYPASVRCYEEGVYFGQTSLLVDEIPVNPGDPVKKGDVLARLDTSDIEKQLEDGQKSLAQSEAQFDNENAGSQTDIDLAQIDYDALVSSGASYTDVQLAKIALERQSLVLEQTKASQAKTIAALQKQLDDWQAQISQAVITAPFDGIVTDIEIAAGSPPTPFATAVVVADPARMYVEYSGSDSFGYSDTYKITAQIGAQTYPLTYTPLTFDEQFAYIMAKATPPARFDFGAGVTADQLKDVSAGEFANITVVTKEDDDVLTIPINALYGSGDGAYVYLYGGGGGAAKTAVPVTTGLINESYAEITGGVSEGDVVYVKQD